MHIQVSPILATFKTKISQHMRKLVLLVPSLLFLLTGLIAQKTTIIGRVTDAKVITIPHASIKFKDSINDLYIGSEFSGQSPIFSLIDNFRISNVSRPIYAPYGEPIDINFSTNLSTVIPVTQDLFTTYLSDFDEIISLNDDFAILKNRKTGLFDFSVNILDSFGIVKDNIKSQEALEKLIKVLKPANSRVFIQYIR